MALSRLLRSHLREMLKLERKSVTALLPIYEQAERELTARILALDARGAGDTFTATHHAAILAQLRSSLAVMRQQLAGALSDEFTSAMATGRRQGLAEITDLERRLAASEYLDRLSTISPVIPAQHVALIAEPQALLLAKFSDGVYTAVSRELAVAMVSGESIPKAARRLVGEIKGQRWQLERIARTEIAQAMNHGHFSALRDVAEAVPEIGLKKQWSAHLDGRTSRRCQGLHLQVREVGEEFRARDGWRGHFPPAHPNCRSRVMPYSPRWETRSVKKIAEQAPGTTQNPRAASKPTRGDRRSARRWNRANQ